MDELDESWRRIEDELPPIGVPVLVFLPFDEHFKYAFECYGVITEQPVSWSSKTVIAGYGWQEHEWNEISHWKYLFEPIDPEPHFV